jgi:hypothetical protein
MAFDVEGAKKAGYTDSEIADHLAQSSSFDAAGARSSGYSDADIISHLSGGAAPIDTGSQQPASQPATAAKESKLKVPTTRMIPKPSYGEVAINAIAKGAAAVPDMFINAAPRVANLATAAGGSALYEMGAIDTPPDLPFEDPNLVAKTGEAVGAINPDYNPQTKGQQYLDVALQGATGGALTGGASLPAVATNALAGAAGATASQVAADQGYGTAGQIAAGLVGGGATAATANRLSGATRNTALQQANAIKDANFKAARDAGIKIPVSQSNPNSLLANTVDIVVGGRPRMQQSAAIANQSKATKAAAKDLGLDVNSPISVTNLKDVKDAAYKTGYEPLRGAGLVTVSPKYGAALDALQAETLNAKKGFAGYDDGGLVKTIDALRTNEFDSASGVDMIRQLREDAGTQYASGNTKMGKALKGAANAIENEMETHLASTGQKQLLTDYRNARQQIAKAMTVEKALNTATGEVSAQGLGRQLNKGAPLSGEMRAIAEASKLPGASLADTKYATTGASQLEGLAALGGAGATGNPLVLAAPIARGIGRKIALTDTVGKMLGTPNYKEFGLTSGNVNALTAGAGLAEDKRDSK